MGDLYKRLAMLCEERGISGYRMCKDVGIQPSIMTVMMTKLFCAIW